MSLLQAPKPAGRVAASVTLIAVLIGVLTASAVAALAPGTATQPAPPTAARIMDAVDVGIVVAIVPPLAPALPVEPSASLPPAVPPAPQIAAPRRLQDQSGIASTYSNSGGRTASGEATNSKSMTAAHRSLPFGTLVRVTNNQNGRSVVVRINDRGPFAKGRVIDLTPGAARELDFDGLTPVKLSIVDSPEVKLSVLDSAEEKK